MKNLALAALLAGLAGLYLPGCNMIGAGAMDTAVAEHQCPSCKQTVKYRYHPTKRWIKTGKEVVHVCPDCKRAWGSNMTLTSTCDLCADAHAKCPICAKH